jgi:hypothetical protein
MPLPQVSCGADYVVAYDANPRTIGLTALATEYPLSYEWTIVGKPVNSVVDQGVKGDFINGKTSVQNPYVEIDGDVDGSYVLQCIAKNVVGYSDPKADKQNCQQVITVITKERSYTIPGKNQYDWATTMIAALRQIEADIITIMGGPQAFYTPENVPRLVYQSSSVVYIDHWDGRGNTLRLKLSDGLWYTADVTLSPLSVDMAVTGRGGREASTSDPELVSTPYYLYAVPSVVPTQFVCMASVNPPPTGVIDLPAWKYLGSVYNDVVGNIRRFVHLSRDIFRYPYLTEEAVEIYVGILSSPALAAWFDTGSLPNIGAPVSGASKVRGLKFAIPTPVAASAILQGAIDKASSPGSLAVDGGQSSDAIFTPTWQRCFLALDGGRQSSWAEVPVRTEQVKFYWVEGSTIDWSVFAVGYRDKFLVAGEL